MLLAAGERDPALRQRIDPRLPRLGENPLRFDRINLRPALAEGQGSVPEALDGADISRIRQHVDLLAVRWLQPLLLDDARGAHERSAGPAPRQLERDEKAAAGDSAFFREARPGPAGQKGAR